MSAVSEIRELLKQESFLGIQHNDVTHGDLVKINNILKGLTPAERNQVISQLSQDELSTWTDEIDNGGGLVGTGLTEGLSAGERADLHNLLAQSLDGAQLARVYNSYGGGSEKTELANSIATHGSGDAKAAFVEQIAGKIDAKANIDAGFTSTTTRYGNQEARDAGQVLASLGGDQASFNRAVQSLNGAGKLDDVLKVAAGRSDTTVSGAGGPGTTLTSYDPAQLNKIINAAAQSSDLGVRTEVFRAAAPQLKDMQGDTRTLAGTNRSAEDAANATAKAMSQLLTPEQARSAGVVPNVPDRPPGVSIQDNVAQAREKGMIWVTREMVPNKQPWDFKQQGAQYESFGNFHFGVVEAAAGMPENVALRGAGWAQRQAGTSPEGSGAPWSLNGGPYGDDPRDQAQIKAGYDYYNSGLWRLWSQ